MLKVNFSEVALVDLVTALHGVRGIQESLKAASAVWGLSA
jgi:hypothetical protein